MTVTLPYPPSANRYWRSFRGRVIKSIEATHYIELVYWTTRDAGLDLLQGDVSLTLRLYRPQKRGDLDNRIKVLLDALQGVAYKDDEQVVELHAFRHDDKENPRVEIVVEKLS